MNKKILVGLATGLFMVGGVVSSNAAIITFDDAVVGSTSYQYDGDGDNVNDVIFSTGDSLGFNTVGPGTNMTYINEPGIEGTTLLSEDLRVDFLNGAVNTLSFGFALNTPVETETVTFNIFDNTNLLLSSNTTTATFTTIGLGLSSFPEGHIDVSFSGIASYAVFDFSSTDTSRYILDNFQGTFGSTEDITPTAPVPEPTTMLLFGTGLIGLAGVTRRKKK